MKIFYANIELKVSKVVKWSMRAVRTEDTMEYLYTHLHIGVRCVVNPAALSAVSANGSDTPTVQTGEVPAVTVAAIKDRILQDRKSLVIVDELANTVIQSPSLDAINNQVPECDARGGPLPIAFEVLEIIGTKTFMAYFEIETWYVNCATRTSPLLSHRWEETREVDSKIYTTRTVVGEVRFRKDALIAYGYQPDDYAWWVSANIPDNFRRTGIKYAQSSDGLTLSYVLTDVEQPRNIINSAVADFEGNYSVGFDQIENAFPARFEMCTIEVWGHRRTSRETLIDVVVQAANQMFNNPLNPGIPFIHPYSCLLTVGLKDRYAKIECKWQAGGAINGLINMFAGNSVRQKALNAIGNNPHWTDANQPGKGPRYRGTYLYRMVAQILRGECARPSVVPAITNEVELDNAQVT